MRRRPPRPGVMAAATTAVLATGEGPGETALATTAVLATGWPMTPTRPTRAALRGISFSCGRLVEVGFDRGEDRLDRDASVCDELTAGATGRGREGGRPQVLPDQHPRGAARVHGRGQVRHVLLGEQLGQLGLELLEGAEVLDVGELHGLDGA